MTGVAAAHRAGFVSRVAADILDAVVVCLGTVVILVATKMMAALFTGSAFSFPRPNGPERFGALSVVYVLYLAFFWSTTGRTPGKQVAGLRVTTSDGAPVSALRALARAVICVVFPIGLVWVLVSRRNLAVHDVLLGTAVVYDWTPRRPATAVSGSPP